MDVIQALLGDRHEPQEVIRMRLNEPLYAHGGSMSGRCCEQVQLN